ncbi:MAG: flagellar hook-length control protein FliK [Phycisphaerales bacterium]
MTTAPNPISPRTADTASTLFAAPSRALKPQSDTRFRDSLDQRVARDEPRTRAEPEARRTSDRATDDAQNTRPSAEDADREPEIRETSGESRESDKGEAVSPDATDGNDGQTTETTGSQPAGETQQAQLIPVSSLEIKPVTPDAPALNSRPVPSEQTPQPRAAQQNADVPRQDDAHPVRNAGPSQEQANAAPALRLAGADADAPTDAQATADNAVRSAAPVDRPDAPPSSQSASNDRASVVEPAAALAGSSASQDDPAGHQDQHDSSRRDPNAVKLPTLDTGATNASDRAPHAVATNDLKTADTPTLRGPTLSVTRVSDAEAAQNERAVASSVSRGLAAAVQQRGGSLTIRLTPATLGTVKIDLELAQGRVSVDLHASTDLAQDAISKNISLLRSSLESKGLTVDRIAVQLTPATNQSNNASTGNANDQQQGDAQRDRDDASDGQSRDSRDQGDERERPHRFDQRFSEAFGLEPGDPRAQTLRLRLSAIG